MSARSKVTHHATLMSDAVAALSLPGMGETKRRAIAACVLLAECTRDEAGRALADVLHAEKWLRDELAVDRQRAPRGWDGDEVQLCVDKMCRKVSGARLREERERPLRLLPGGAS